MPPQSKRGTIDAFRAVLVASPAASPHALIVCRNAGTSAGLRNYFDHAGIRATVTDLLDVPADRSPFTAVVMFPDEFPEQGATVGLRMLARKLPHAWIVVVTRHTSRFQALVAIIASKRLFVLPRPVWGWALLDRILQRPPDGE